MIYDMSGRERLMSRMMSDWQRWWPHSTQGRVLRAPWPGRPRAVWPASRFVIAPRRQTWGEESEEKKIESVQMIMTKTCLHYL